MSFAWRVALVVVASAGAGCVYRTPEAHIPASMPAIAPAALEVDCVSVDDAVRPLDARTEAEVRGETTTLLKKAADARAVDGAPAHIRAHVTLGDRGSIDDAMRRDGLAAIGYLSAPFGLVIDRQELSVEVTVETGGRTFTGQGKAERLGSIYAHARRRALAVALDRALADASAKASTPP